MHRAASATLRVGGAALGALAQHLLHRLALGQLVDELVEVADLAHQRLLDVLDPLAADQALDFVTRGIEPGSLGEERLEVGRLSDLGLQPFL